MSMAQRRLPAATVAGCPATPNSTALGISGSAWPGPQQSSSGDIRATGFDEGAIGVKPLASWFN